MEPTGTRYLESGWNVKLRAVLLFKRPSGPVQGTGQVSGRLCPAAEPTCSETGDCASC
jgi:hypothetical protein